jgi:hypothetical protein
MSGQRPVVRFGIGTGNRRPFPELLAQWRWIEELGFDTAWVVDHFMAADNEDTPYFEAWTLIAALGVQTERLRFGVLVSGNTYRNPGLLAKMAVTLDHATGGRVELGIGAGWWEREHRAYSFPFPSTADRIAMLEEAIQIIDRLQRERRVTFRGRFYQFEDAPFEPKPIQQPRIPLIVGAFKPRMLRLAAATPISGTRVASRTKSGHLPTSSGRLLARPDAPRTRSAFRSSPGGLRSKASSVSALSRSPISNGDSPISSSRCRPNRSGRYWNVALVR